MAEDCMREEVQKSSFVVPENVCCIPVESFFRLNLPFLRQIQFSFILSVLNFGFNFH